jgi:hypothetical protein
MRRYLRNRPRRANPLRDVVAGQKRAADVARDRERAEQLRAELPSLIENRVGEHLQKLETKLLKDFQQMGQKAMDESTAVLSDQLTERIGTLEQISSIQSRTIGSLRDSSQVADQQVSAVVNSIERSLSAAVPGGFELEAPKYPPAQIAEPLEARRTELIRSEPEDMSEAGKHGFCPKCTSTNVRRAYRKGIWEEILRVFFLAPFRCRACRHKFYRVSNSNG